MSVFEANLPLPPRLKKDTLRVVPLGGLGEVGRNMTVYEINGKLLIVDCGVLFPEESQPGVDLILPDFSYIVDRLDDVVGSDPRPRGPYWRGPLPAAPPPRYPPGWFRTDPGAG